MSAEQVKYRMLSDAGLGPGQSGIITTQPNFKIEYIAGPDTFLVEIANGGDIEEAKKAAEQWLMSQGFQPSDFCHGITVTFFLGAEAKKAAAGKTFDPVPSGCRSSFNIVPSSQEPS